MKERKKDYWTSKSVAHAGITRESRSQSRSTPSAVLEDTMHLVDLFLSAFAPSWIAKGSMRSISMTITHPAAQVAGWPSSTPAHSHNSFPSGIAVEPDEQQALTYLNRERKVFWAAICLFPSSYPARYFRNEGFSLTGKEIELPWQPRAQHPFIYIGFDVRLAKSFIRSGKNFFPVKTVSLVDMVRGVVFRSET